MEKKTQKKVVSKAKQPVAKKNTTKVIKTDERKVILSIRNIDVKFRVRGRILTAIRNVSLDIYENESIAIVGESGSGKSVFTKTFNGMLDDNGYIENGQIMYNDPTLAETNVSLNDRINSKIYKLQNRINEISKFAAGAEVYKQLLELKAEKKAKLALTEEEENRISKKIDDINFKKTELGNYKQTIDPKNKEKIKEVSEKIKVYEEHLADLEKEKANLLAAHKNAFYGNANIVHEYEQKKEELKQKHSNACKKSLTEAQKAKNLVLAKEVYLSVGRYPFLKRNKAIRDLIKALENAFKLGVNLDDEETRNQVFGTVCFRVKLVKETHLMLYGECVTDLSKIRLAKDWQQVRGKRIATIFQDPMTSLNPIITIGKQITSIILKHQACSEVEARRRAILLMKKVGIPQAEKRFDDYPFQYSGGMRQRIVIAIALSCQPKILICDEPTTALDVTIQAQILQLIKDLQKEFQYTIVFITHDLGVVANIADRVAVFYGGQIIELGTVEDVFYDPRHPYTWALLSSLPQLAERNTQLYSITGTPPSLYNKIVGDAFAPRNPYCLKIDTLKEPPMFKVSETHYAKTWLLDPRAPKVEKPKVIENIHEKLIKAFNI